MAYLGRADSYASGQTDKTSTCRGEMGGCSSGLSRPDLGSAAPMNMMTAIQTSALEVVMHAGGLARHRTIVVVDVEGYGNPKRTTPHRLVVRAGLYRALEAAFEDSGIPWGDCRVDDCGDGVFFLAPAEVPKALFVEVLPAALAGALRRHNASSSAEERIRLRVGLHAGEVAYDEHGVTAPSVILAFRLLDSPSLKKALTESSGVLALITSSWFYDEVVRHSSRIDAATFRSVEVIVKETNTTGWVSLPDSPYPAVSGRSADGARGPGPCQLPPLPPKLAGRQAELAILEDMIVSSSPDPAPGSLIFALAGTGGIGRRGWRCTGPTVIWTISPMVSCSSTCEVSARTNSPCRRQPQSAAFSTLSARTPRTCRSISTPRPLATVRWSRASEC